MQPEPVAALSELFTAASAQDYLGEPVTVSVHLRQTGELAQRAGARPALVAAALLHDVGHLVGAISGRELMQGTENRHGQSGADWLGQWFASEVTEPVRLHVAAKRYLCGTDPAYYEQLSEASKYTLGLQGGPMSAAEVAAFEALPHAADTVRLRRWDDLAKDATHEPPPFEHFLPVLRGLIG